MKGHNKIRANLAVYDSLPVAEQAELDRHLRECSACAEQLAAYRRMDQKLARLHDPWPGPQVAHTVEAALNGRPAPASRPRPVQTRENSATGAPSFVFSRLLLPAAMALVFAISVWVGLRFPEQATLKPALTPIAAVPSPMPSLQDVTGHVTITFACSGAEYGVDYKQIAEEFQRENPDITVNVVRMDAIQPTTWGATSLGLGIMLPPGDNFKLAAGSDAFCSFSSQDIWAGHIRDLTPFIAADADFQQEDFFPGILRSWTLNEKIYALPTFFRPKLIYYNPAAFDAAGISYPRPGWTWDDLLAMATQLTQRTGDSTTRWGIGDPHLTLLQVRAGTELNLPANISYPDSILPANAADLLRWFNELYVVRRVAPIPETLRTGEFIPGDWPTFMEDVVAGRYAMWVDDAYPYARRGGQPVPFPAGSSDDRTTPVGLTTADVLSLSAYSPYPDATWRWLSYLSRHLFAPRYDMLPVRRSLMAQEAFWARLTPAAAEAYRYAFEHLAPNKIYYISAEHNFTRMVRDLATGEKDLQTLLAELESPATPQPAQTEIATVLTATPASSKSATGRFIWPATGPVTREYSPEHPGIEIAGAFREPVKAADGGTVIMIQEDAVYGHFVAIDHGYGFTTMYAHLNSIAVQFGQQVAQGELIGKMGMAANATEPTLYFAIYGNSGPVDPLQYVR